MDRKKQQLQVAELMTSKITTPKTQSLVLVPFCRSSDKKGNDTEYKFEFHTKEKGPGTICEVRLALEGSVNETPVDAIIPNAQKNRFKV